MGWWWGCWWESINSLSRKWTQELEVVSYAIPSQTWGSHPLPWEFTLLFEWGLSAWADTKLWSKPSNLPITLKRIYFYKIWGIYFQNPWRIFVQHSSVRSSRHPTEPSSSLSAMFSTTHHLVSPAHLLKIPTGLPDLPFPLTSFWLKGNQILHKEPSNTHGH